jgi:hypothetical protein
MVFDVDEICGADPEEENQPSGEFQPDLKPEFCLYKDEGCKLAPSCLKCRYKRCIYDLPKRKQRRYKKRRNQQFRVRQIRNKQIARLYKAGIDPKEIAEKFELTQRTVFRITSGKSANKRKSNTNAEN